MAFEFDETDFVDLAPVGRGTVKADLRMACVMIGGKSKVARVQFSLAEGLAAELGGHRYTVQYAARRRLFRIRPDAAGRLEMMKTPKGSRFLIRAPMPAIGFDRFDGVIEPDYDLQGGDLVVALPEARARPWAPVAVVPAPARPAVTDEEVGALVEARLKELLVGEDLPPAELGGVRFAPAERAILATLLRRTQASREALLAATHDPVKGEDERDPKVVDVWISKLRPRLGALGLTLVTLPGGAWKLPPDAKAGLRRLMEAA